MGDSVDVEAAKLKALETAEKAKEEAKKIFQFAQENGFMSHFYPEYVMELLTPWKLVMSDEAITGAESIKDKALVLADKAKTEIVSTVTLTRSTDARKSFILYNVLAFWFGVFESLVAAMFGAGFISLVWNGGISFFVAYTLYWTMTCTGQKPFMFYSMCFVLLYTAFNIYMGLQYLIFVVPGLLYFAKALCDVLMLINGYWLYKDVIGPEGSLML